MNIALILALVVAADPPSERPLPALVAAVGREGMGMPGVATWGLWGPPQPAFSLGVELPLGARGAWRFFDVVELGAWLHRDVQNAVRLTDAVGVRWCADVGFVGEAQLGVGYLHAFTPGQAFVLAPGGGLAAAGQGGRPRLTFELDLGLGWSFGGPAARWAIVLRYRFVAEVPFASGGLEVPLMGHSVGELGFRLPLELLVGGAP